MTREGCSSICDGNGELLFYTDGSVVFDKNHTLMTNGSGLMGNSSATQSSVIAPKPGTYNTALKRFEKYYIFTCDAVENNPGNGVRYSEVDMAMSAGNGDINPLLKNVHLFGTLAVEAIAIAINSNGCDYWVVSHEADNNHFRSYRITENGVDLTPVITAIGPITPTNIGSIKISPNNKLLCLTNGNGTTGGLHLFRFNNSTGSVTDLIFSDLPLSNSMDYYYSEFSTNSKVLYASNAIFNIQQFNLDETAPVHYLASKTTVGTYIPGLNGALQMAPNGKIYVTHTNTAALSVINSPDNIGSACNYVSRQQDISGYNVNGDTMFSVFGLPSFLSTIFNDSPSIQVDSTIQCNLKTFCFSLTPDLHNDLNWRILKDGSPFLDSNTVNFCHSFNQPGNYSIAANINSYCITDTFHFNFTVAPIPGIPIHGNLFGCTEITLDAGQQFSSYQWSNGATSFATQVTGADNPVSLIVTDNLGCLYYSDTVSVNTPGNPVTFDTLTICQNDSILIHNQFRSLAGNYTQLFTIANGCDSISNVYLIVLPQPQVYIQADATIGNAPFAVVFSNSSVNAQQYIWEYGEGISVPINSNNSQSHTYNIPGIYTVTLTASNDYCTDTDSILIVVLEAKTPQIIVPNVFTPNSDGKNDFFELNMEHVLSIQFIIFNRWGNQIYEINDIDGKWDGKVHDKEASDGVYFYQYTLIGTDNIQRSGNGNFTLIR